MKFVFALLMLLLPFQVFSQEREPLGPDAWPTTLKAAVADIISIMSEADKATVRKTKKADLIQFHHGWGTGIRNHYGLWRGNHKLLESACGNPCVPDDASVIIIENVWKELRKQP